MVALWQAATSAGDEDEGEGGPTGSRQGAADSPTAPDRAEVAAAAQRQNEEDQEDIEPADARYNAPGRKWAVDEGDDRGAKHGVITSGLMWSQGQNFGGWKQRWFELTYALSYQPHPAVLCSLARPPPRSSPRCMGCVYPSLYCPQPVPTTAAARLLAAGRRI